MANTPAAIAESASPRTRSPLTSSLHFARHLLEMLIAMGLGMVAGAAIFLTAAGGLTPIEGMKSYPVLFVCVMAFSMTAPMIAWMRLRGHGSRSCTEMGASMVIPAVPIIALYLLGVIPAPLCGMYCVFSTLAMIILMVYRRRDYAM